MLRAVSILTLAALGAAAVAQQPRAQTPPDRPVGAGPRTPAGQPPAPATQNEPQRTTATFADWTLRCVRPENTPPTCEVTQTIYDKSQPVAQTALGRPGKSEPLRLTILVPSNILVTSAPKFQPGDNDPALELAWRRCLPAGCLADVALNQEELTKLRNRTNPGRIVFQDGAGHDTVVPFSPKGLGPALDELAKETS